MITTSKRYWIGSFLVGFLVLTFLVGCGQDKPRARLCILHTNDVHGHVIPEQVSGERVGTGGAAVLAAWIKQVKTSNAREGIPTLVVDAGDIFTGTPEGNLKKGAEIVGLMNLLGYEAMTIGNHEFDFGYYNLKLLAEQAQFPFLAANISRGQNGSVEFIDPFVILEKGELKLGILGVTTAEIPKITLAGNTGEILFKDPEGAALATLDIFKKERVDLVIALTHLGVSGDKELAEKVPGIDVIIGGHSHTLLTEPLQAKSTGTIICQVGSYGRWAGKLDLWIDPESGRVDHYEYEVFTNLHGSFPPELEVTSFLSRLENMLDPKLRRVYGLALSEFKDGSDAEFPLGDLVADAMRASTSSDLAFENPYGIRWPIFPGKVTGRDIFMVVPFDDSLVTMDLTGRQIRRLMEQSFTLEKGMLQVSGLVASYDLDKPIGSRLVKLLIGENKVDDYKNYRVTVNGFLAGGGDGFSTFLEGTSRRNAGILLRDALADHIRKLATIDQASYPRTRLLPSN